jgi:hypothetical protein
MRPQRPICIPPPVDASFARRLFWRATREGRARLALWEAGRTPGLPTRAAAAQALTAIEAAQNASARTLLRDGLFFLAASAHNDGNVSEAANTLATMDRLLPAEPARVELRRALIARLREREPDGTLSRQTKLLLADPAAANIAPEQEVLDTLGTIADAGSREDSKLALSSTAPAWLRHPRIAVAKALTDCPSTFATKADAARWLASVSRDRTGFPPRLEKDALLIQARAFESLGDFGEMEKCARAAWSVVAETSEAYWLIRARLYDPESNPDAIFPAVYPKQRPDWQRLTALCRLHASLRQDPANLTPSGAVVDSLATRLSDPQEYSLTLRLLQRALTSPAARSNANLPRLVELSKRVAAQRGAPSWATVNIALGEFLLTGEWENASDRLEPFVAADSEAVALRRAGLFFAGARQRDGTEPFFGLAERCLDRLLGSGDTRVPPQRSVAASPVALAALGVQDMCAALLPWLTAIETELHAVPGAVPRPRWVDWLAVRAWLSAYTQHPEGDFMPPEAVSDAAAAWEVSAWWDRYGTNTPPPRAVDAARVILRTANLKLTDRSLGSIAATTATDSRAFVKAIDDARALIPTQPAAARDAFEAIAKRLPTANVFTLRMWRPLCSYWLGVACAESEPRRAWRAFASVIGTVKDADARAQLTLLAIRQGRMRTAARWVERLQPNTPAVLYAQALLHARRGERAAAEQLLESFGERFGNSSSPYVAASARLHAALAERAGDLEAAEARHTEVLAKLGNDPLTRARLGRLQLRRAYEAGGPLDDEQEDLASAAEHIAWCRGPATLQRLMARESDPVDLYFTAEPLLDGPGARAWRQTLTNRLLAQALTKDALDIAVLPGEGETPLWHRRTQLILHIWRGLIALWRPLLVPTHEAIAVEAQRLASEAPDQGTDESRWVAAEQRLTDHAEAVARGDEARIRLGSLIEEIENFPAPDAVFERWRSLLRHALGKPGFGALTRDASLLGALPGLWAADGAERLAAARTVAAEFEGGETPARLARFLAAWLTGRDDVVLDLYDRLLPFLDTLPVPGSLIWSAAATVRMKQKEWQMLLDGDLPDAVADLAQPEARLLIASAYASAAAVASRDDPRAALQHLRHARNTLEPLSAPEVT